jgi:DNA repair protein RecN (Recombination protein N)
MLKSITIKNFIIINELTVNFESGFTILTGPSGSGKSLVFKAMAFCFGKKVDRGILKDPSLPCEVELEMDLSQLKTAYAKHLTIKRTLLSNGKSRYLLNEENIKVSELQKIYQALFNYSEQHQHYTLLDQTTHLDYLDEFVGTDRELLQTAFNEFKEKRRQLDQFERARHKFDEPTVAHYVDELSDFFAVGTDYEALQDEILQLKDIARLKTSAEQLQASLDLGKGLGLIHELVDSDIPDTLSSSLIHFQDAHKDILDAIDHFLDEDRSLKLSELTKRMNHWHDLARKHQVHPMDLNDTFQQLQESLSLFQSTDMDALRKDLSIAESKYGQTATNVSNKRRDQALVLSELMTQWMQRLGIKNGIFKVEVSPAIASAIGIDQVAFKVATNIGQEPLPLSGVVSGGELSRIGLAIEEVCQSQLVAVQLLDEVDVGISGAVAEQVATLLYKRSQKTQILCITHLPQMAMLADQHGYIEKTTEDATLKFTFKYLNIKERETALAELLSGEKIDERGLQHARAMLSQGQSIKMNADIMAEA